MFDLQKVSKAVAAFLAGLVVMWLTKHNVVIADKLPDALEIVIGAIITAVSVYFAPRNK